jgi:hypothetical protein
MASEAEVVGALAANMTLTDMLMSCISDVFYVIEILVR